MHLQSYLRSAAEIIGLYNDPMPFAAWLKNHFKQHKKFGSTDRKAIADLCFCYYRLGHAFAYKTIGEKLLIGQFLCRQKSLFINEFKPEWNEAATLSIREKLVLLSPDKEQIIFPFLEEVSGEISTAVFNRSHLVQPDLFLRIRPGRREDVLQKMSSAEVAFSTEGDCLRLPNTTKIDDLIALDDEAVVQDKSSQQVLGFLQSEIANRKLQIRSAWDCCAASGGKSIALYDAFPKVQLTATDVRESILHNLRSRFKRAGIRSYRSFVANVASAGFALDKTFDVIICDAPCSGSGTWGRTPEQLWFFQNEKIEHYASLQKAIAVNAVRYLKESGLFLYITCSVFKRENEDVVDYITQQTPLRLLKQQYFKGYEEKADTLFVALFATHD